MIGRPLRAVALLPSVVATLLLAGPAAAADPAPPPTVAPPPAVSVKWSNDDYWAFVDRRQADVEPQWRADLGVYMPKGNTDDVRMDANMLLVHADAAIAGHQGPSRQDARVIQLADALTRAPAYLHPPTRRTGGQAHTPGWSSSTIDKGAQHVAIDPQVAAGLTAAWQARAVVGMSQQLSDRIVVAIHDVANSSFFKYPSMLLDQWNWHGDMDAFAAQITGNMTFLDEYRAQLVRFVQGTRVGLKPGRTPYMNAGLGLIYSPRKAGSTGAAVLSTSEYESLIYSGLRHYDWAVSKGMAPLDPADEDLLRQWSLRVMFGDWTHAGALNWDTSLGTQRWHLARYWAFAQQGVEALADAGRLAGTPEQPAWAVWLAQRSLQTYEHLAAVFPSKRLPSGMWGIAGKAVSPDADPAFTASRVAVTAAEFAAQGFGTRKSVAPPSWFAYDPDAQRLAVSTPAYSTGILVAHPKDDYGGIEVARLYDSLGDPVSGTGGGRRSAFGIDLNVGGRVRLDSQPGKRVSMRGDTVFTVQQNGQPALRGTFDTGLVASGSVSNSYGLAEVATTFGATGIVVDRRIRAARSGRVTVRFPVWGRKGSVRVVRAKGKPGRLTTKPVMVDAVKKAKKSKKKKKHGTSGKQADARAASTRSGSKRKSTSKGKRKAAPKGPSSSAQALLLRAERGGYRAALCNVPKGARLRLATLPASSTSERTRHVALLTFPIKAKESKTISVRLTPTDTVPRSAPFCA